MIDFASLGLVRLSSLGDEAGGIEVWCIEEGGGQTLLAVFNTISLCLPTMVLLRNFGHIETGNAPWELLIILAPSTFIIYVTKCW